MTAGSGHYYRSFEGDVLDRIVWKHYSKFSNEVLGRIAWISSGSASPEMLQMVYDANPSLNEYGVVLPEGVEIFLPDAPPPPRREAMRLW